MCDACHAQIHGTTPPHSPSSSTSSPPPSLASRSASAGSRPPTPRRSRTLPPAPPPPDPSLPDDLRNYPLRIRSDICKATGGGRWTPKPSPVPAYMKRVPGRKAPYEIALEEEEEAARRAHANPIVRDGGKFLSAPRHALPTHGHLPQNSSIGHHAHIHRAFQSVRSSFLHSDSTHHRFLSYFSCSFLFWSTLLLLSILWYTLTLRPLRYTPTLPTPSYYLYPQLHCLRTNIAAVHAVHTCSVIPTCPRALYLIHTLGACASSPVLYLFISMLTCSTIIIC